jgi:hypothetical protein
MASIRISLVLSSQSDFMFYRDWFALEGVESELGYASLPIHGATARSAHGAVEMPTGNREVCMIE